MGLCIFGSTGAGLAAQCHTVVLRSASHNLNGCLAGQLFPMLVLCWGSSPKNNVKVSMGKCVSNIYPEESLIRKKEFKFLKP